MDVRDHIEYLLDKEEAPKFAEWAVGPNFRTISYKDYPGEWNKLHGDKLTVHGKDNTSDTLKKMIDFWKEENNE